MAGIGFELKKVMGKKGFINGIRGYTYAAFVTIGPIILCILLLITLKEILKYLNVPYLSREVFLAAVLYAFAFSLITVSGFAMLLSRFVADSIYREEYKKIAVSFYGITAICILLGGVLGFVFYYSSPLPWPFKLGAYLLYLELIIIFLLMIYVSALKDYKRIFYAFLWGILLAVVSAYIMGFIIKINTMEAMIFSMDIGFLFTISTILYALEQYFEFIPSNFFEFLTYFEVTPKLFFINLFYTAGIYIHNILFWFNSDLSVYIGNTFKIAPIYDIASFFAMLTILPSTVIFVVKVETSFYDKYKQYFEAIIGGGGLRDIEQARKNMVAILWEELGFVLEVQLIISVCSIILSSIFLPLAGISDMGREIFSMLVLGYYTVFMMFIIITVILYFDDKTGALYITVLFFVLNTVLTQLTITWGHAYYGFGMFIAGTISLIIAVIYLVFLLKGMNYRIFCSQPIFSIQEESKYKKFIKKLG